MAESTFDAEAFMAQSVEAESETSYTPIPADDYNAMIEKVSIPRTFTREDGSEVPILEILYNVLDDNVKEMMEMDQVLVSQSIFLDVILDENNNPTLAFGKNKNVKLGYVRAATGQNTPAPWNYKMLEGAGPLRIKVGVQVDKDDPEKIYNRVNRVSKIT